MEELTIAIIFDAITKLGATGVLIVGIWAFITGRIWPKEQVERALEAQREMGEKTAELISKTVCEEISNGVKKGISEGIVEGYLKINNREAS